MATGFAFGGFGTCRDFGIVDIVAFLAAGTGDFHLKGSKVQGSAFKVQRFNGSEVQRFGIVVNPEPLNLGRLRRRLRRANFRTLNHFLDLIISYYHSGFKFF
jgi:hypothetical protein